MQEQCSLCDKCLLCHNNSFPLLINEFEHSYLMIGDHQFYPGYSVLVLKDHHTTLHELDDNIQKGLFDELMRAAKAINQAFNPLKINYACLGNQVGHIHWHIFPRYQTEENPLADPFFNSQHFKLFPTNKDPSANNKISAIRTYLI